MVALDTAISYFLPLTHSLLEAQVLIRSIRPHSRSSEQ